VYIAGRTAAGILKWSLHESGDWRHAFTSRFARASGIDERVLDQWEAPEPDQAGWRRGLGIRIPAEDVVDLSDSEGPHEDVVWIPERQDGAMTYLHVVVVQPNEGITEGLLPVGAFRLEDGRAVIVGVAWRVNTPEEQVELDRLRAEALSRLPADVPLPPDPSGMRVSVLGFENDGAHRIVCDLAYRPNRLPPE
jgi:hypothetical protein